MQLRQQRCGNCQVSDIKNIHCQFESFEPFEPFESFESYSETLKSKVPQSVLDLIG
jgi:hypothetical protein